jgi:predicted TIM-barrel fold metal-dependent hydrolase
MARYRGPVVDAHHHLWRRGRETIPWLAGTGNEALADDYRPADYREAAGGLDIVATVWIEAVARDPLAEAKEAAQLHRIEPSMASAIVAHAPLDAPDITDRLDRLADAATQLAGIRDIVAVRPGHSSFARASDLLRRPAFAAGLAELARRGLVFDLMLEPWQMAEALALARRLPELQIVIEHAGSPDFASEDGTQLWRDAMRSAAALPNIAVKISALHCRMPGWTDARLAEPIRDLVDWFGPERLAFASDFPVHDRTTPFARGFETFAEAVSDLSEREQAALFHDTARRLYRI